MSKQIQTALTILRRKQVENRIGIGRSSIYDKLNPKSRNYDPTFPRMVLLGSRSVGWYEHEIEEWLASRQRSTLKGGEK